MTHLEALVSLNMACDIGSIRLNKLLKFFDKPQNILKAMPEKLMAVSGIGKEIAFKIISLKKEDLDKEFALARKYGLKIIIQEDEGYPENLKNIPDPPIVLYVKGVLEAKDKFSIGIVGSRRASFYGLSHTEKFAADLADRGMTIVSGLARGIDSSAHRGALKAGGRTIAIMGSGFKHLYPPENKELAEEISRSGAVISEFPMDAKPLPQNFPRRNRIISGLSLGVLVVEAARNSGALITVNFALEQGREVFALPGKIDSRTSFGTNELIKQGAKLVCCTDDILEEFGLFRTMPTCGPNRGRLKEDAQEDNMSGVTESPAALSEEGSKQGAPDKESLLCGLISREPISLDEIIEKTKLGVSQAIELLFKLQMKKIIKQLPGRQFVRG